MVIPESTSAEFTQERPVIECPVFEYGVNPRLHITGSSFDLVRLFQYLFRHNISDGVAIDNEVKDQSYESGRSVHPVFELGSEGDLKHEHGDFEVAPIDYYCWEQPCVFMFLLLFNNAYQNQRGHCYHPEERKRHR